MSFFRKRENNSTTKVNNNQQETIEVFDEFGQKMLVSKNDWRDSVLPGQLKRHWHEPDALYKDIVLSVQDGFISEVLAASKHLYDIDPIRERSYTILAIVQMKLNNLKEAEKLLQEYIQKYGKTGTILTNLAKVYSAQNDSKKSQELLWESICIDPNQENGFAWWAAIQKEKCDPEAYIKCIEKACEIKGSWLPQLHLARYYLEKKELERAKELYQEMMPYTKERSDILCMMSGDLGNNGYINEVIDLLVPMYDVEHQDIRIGINLLQAYLESSNYKEGQELLNKLMQLNRYDLREHLMNMSNKFEDIRTADIDRTSIQTEAPNIVTVCIDKPIWWYGLNSPDWLLPERQRSKKVGILPFADRTERKSKNNLSRETNSGRLSRSIALFISELMIFFSDLEPSVFFPIASGVGLAISQREYKLDDLKETASKMQLDYVVSGSVTEFSSEYQIIINIFDVSLQTTSSKEYKLTFDSFGTSFYQMITEITAMLPVEPDYQSKKVLPFYQVPNSKNIYGYLVALGQSLVQTIAENELCSTESLWGERNILNSYMQLFLAEPENNVFKIILISGLTKSKSYGSNIYKEFKEQAITLLSNDGFASRMLPIAYKTFDMDDKEYIVKTKEVIDKTIDDKMYAEWLARINK